jgi:uncharacterized membrane protein YgdD (TMEM256/DUF423 family)
MSRLWMTVAALLGFVFVALLALSAHGPELLAALFDLRLPGGAGGAAGASGGGKPPAAAPTIGGPLRLGALEQALLVHGFHVLALGLAALWIGQRGGFFANLAALGFAAGTVLFCAPIWARASGLAADPSLTPLGGSILLGAWALFALAAMFDGSATAAPRPAQRPSPAPAPARPPAAAPRGWLSGSQQAARPAQPGGGAEASRGLPVETRHQPPAAPRPAVSGGPRRPAVSR